MSKIKFVSVLVLLTLLLSVVPGAVVAQAPSPGDPGTRAIVDTITLPEDHNAYDYADDVRRAGDHGGDDYWAIFYSGPYELPAGVWADSWINQGHIWLNKNRLLLPLSLNWLYDVSLYQAGGGSRRLVRESAVVKHARG